MRVAVTGSTGLVGHHATRAALAAGHEVRALTRRGSRHRVVDGAEQVTADLGDAAMLERALTGVDAVIHCAAVYAYGPERVDDVNRTNVEGTRTLLEAAARAGVQRAVVTSSSVTCGSSSSPLARTEDDHLGHDSLGDDSLGAEPAPAYYTSKVAQEEVTREVSELSGIPTVLALPTVVLGGPYARLGPSNAIVLRYLLDPTRTTLPGGCNVVDARDVGAGLVLLLERGEPGERYLLGGEDVTWRALHTLVADLAGVPAPMTEVPPGVAWLASAAAELYARATGTDPLSTREEASTVGRYYWYSCARAQQIGYAAQPARVAVASSLAWLSVDPALPRWVREGLRLRPEVRAARPLVPRPLTRP